VSRGVEEFESSGFWQSGYVDMITGDVREFDHKQDYEDALGQVVASANAEALVAEVDQAWTAEEWEAEMELIDNAIDGDPIEFDLGSLHYFVREWPGRELHPDELTVIDFTDEYDFTQRQGQGLTRISAQGDRRNCVVWPRRLLAGVGGCELPEQSGRVVTATAGIA
jgi:hypothetical protein